MVWYLWNVYNSTNRFAVFCSLALIVWVLFSFSTLYRFFSLVLSVSFARSSDEKNRNIRWTPCNKNWVYCGDRINTAVATANNQRIYERAHTHLTWSSIGCAPYRYMCYCLRIALHLLCICDLKLNLFPFLPVFFSFSVLLCFCYMRSLGRSSSLSLRSLFFLFM